MDDAFLKDCGDYKKHMKVSGTDSHLQVQLRIDAGLPAGTAGYIILSVMPGLGIPGIKPYATFTQSIVLDQWSSESGRGVYETFVVPIPKGYGHLIKTIGTVSLDTYDLPPILTAD